MNLQTPLLGLPANLIFLPQDCRGCRVFLSYLNVCCFWIDGTNFLNLFWENCTRGRLDVINLQVPPQAYQQNSFTSGLPTKLFYHRPTNKTLLPQAYQQNSLSQGYHQNSVPQGLLHQSSLPQGLPPKLFITRVTIKALFTSVTTKAIYHKVYHQSSLPQELPPKLFTSRVTPAKFFTTMVSTKAFYHTGYSTKALYHKGYQQNSFFLHPVFQNCKLQNAFFWWNIEDFFLCFLYSNCYFIT